MSAGVEDAPNGPGSESESNPLQNLERVEGKIVEALDTTADVFDKLSTFKEADKAQVLEECKAFKEKVKVLLTLFLVLLARYC